MSKRPRRNHSPAKAKIGALTLANDFLVGALGQRWSVADRKAMIGRAHALPLIAQARQHGISRGSICYLPRQRQGRQDPPDAVARRPVPDAGICGKCGGRGRKAANPPRA